MVRSLTGRKLFMISKYWSTQKLSKSLPAVAGDRLQIWSNKDALCSTLKFFKEMFPVYSHARRSFETAGSRRAHSSVHLIINMSQRFEKPVVFHYLSDSLCSLSKYSDVYLCSVAISQDETPLHDLKDASFMHTGLWCWLKKGIGKMCCAHATDTDDPHWKHKKSAMSWKKSV